MSITAAPEKRTLASTFFAIYTLVVALSGLALLYLGVTWQPLAGLLFYPTLGFVLVACGVLLFRRRRSGLWLFGLASLATWIWGMVASKFANGVAPSSGVSLPPLAMSPLSFSELALAGMAVLGFVFLACWPAARRRLVGVARPGYFIINGALPVAMIATIVIMRLA